MAVYMGNDGVLSIAGVDLSDHVTRFSIEESYDALETTALGDTHKTRIAGLGDFVLTAEFHQDQAASETYATLQPLVGTVATFAGRADSANVSTTNQQVSGSVLVTEFVHMNIEPGTVDTFAVSWPGSGALTVATTT